jgi:xanthine dehydrogenase accessory factor
MRPIATRLRSWLDGDFAGALVRLIHVDGSAPRELGATMLVGADGSLFGSLSAGCVEGAVVERAQALLADPMSDAIVAEFGTGSDPDFDRGLSCGGSMTLLLQTIRPEDRAPLCTFTDATLAGKTAILVTRLAGRRTAGTLAIVGAGDAQPEIAGSLGLAHLDAEIAEARSAMAGPDLPAVSEVDLAGTPAGDRILVHVQRPGPRLVIVGADAFAAALSEVAHVVGWRVTIIDPRAMFTTPERFPHADTIVDWPDRYLAVAGAALGPDDAVCVLTHDDKVDVPAVIGALQTDVGYLGAMGSRATHEDRMRRLRAADVDESALARLRSPIGLDIGARVPHETAISVMAEIVAVRSGRSGAALRTTRGPIRPTSRPDGPCQLRPIS